MSTASQAAKTAPLPGPSRERIIPDHVPPELNFDRPLNRHFTLGGGTHRCLGSHLAGRELRIALSEFLRRIPPFRLWPDAPVTVHPGLMALPHLHLVWDSPRGQTGR